MFLHETYIAFRTYVCPVVEVLISCYFAEALGQLVSCSKEPRQQTAPLRVLSSSRDLIPVREMCSEPIGRNLRRKAKTDSTTCVFPYYTKPKLMRRKLNGRISGVEVPALQFGAAYHKDVEAESPGKENFESTKTAKMIEHFMFPT